MEKTNNTSEPLYNTKLLVKQMEVLGLTPALVAEKANISEPSVNRGLVGTLSTIAKLKRLTDALEVKWEYITLIDLPEDKFSRAVRKQGRK